MSSILLSLLLSYYLVISDQQEVQNYTATIAVLSAFIGLLITYTLYFVTIKLDRLLPWQTQTNNRLFFGLLFQYLLSIVISIGSFYVYYELFIGNDGFFIEYRETLIKLSILLFILLLIYTVIYFAFYSYYSFATLQIESVKQERKQIDLQLKALKSQLSPHFLFNSLNTISSLVYKDQKKSETFIRKLAKLYQYTLQSYHSRLITLKEELEFVNSYLFLLQTRFENKFTIDIQIPDDILNSDIPPLTLQLLIENAVKHNVLDASNPLEIKIYKEEEKIVVKNTVTKSPIAKDSFKIGLKNINSRYLLLVNKGISITNGNYFTVKIPIIK